MSASAGDAVDLGGGWEDVKAMAVDAQAIYIAAGMRLCRIDRRTGEYSEIGEPIDVRAMVATDEFLYVIEADEHLYRVNKGTGNMNDLGPGWSNVEGFTAIGDRMYVVSEGHLFEIEVAP